MNTLGTLGTIRDNSATYAKGSYELTVEFVMFGLTFKAHKFVRTDSCPMDNVRLYIKHESHWCDDHVKLVDQANPCKVGARAMHLIAVAMTTAPSGMDERYAAIELA